MSRLVKSKTKKGSGIEVRTASADPDQGTNIQEYTERVAKYVPAEIIATFTALSGVFANSTEDIRFWGLAITTLVFWILTPIYFWWSKRATDDLPALRMQQWLSSIAFIIWAYVISGQGGVFADERINIYQPEIGSAVIILFSFISGFFIPRKTTA